MPGLSKKYRSWDPQAYANLHYSPAKDLPDGDLVFFLIDLIPRLDLSPFYASDEVETRGAPPFDPAKMVTLLTYSYCVGVFSSRKIALACERNLAFLAIVGDDRPDFRTTSDFRKEHLGAFPDLFLRGNAARVPRRSSLSPPSWAWSLWATWPSTAASSRPTPPATRP
jgi:hypothetical protein